MNPSDALERGLSFAQAPRWPLALVILAAAFVFVRQASLPAFETVLPEGFGQPLQMAQLLLGEYLFAFELISIVLLVALVGALALGRNERKLPWK